MTADQARQIIRDIQTGLAHAHEGNPVWDAALRLLEIQIEEATLVVTSPGAPLRDFAAGHLAGLRGLRESLQHHRRIGMTGAAVPEP